MEEKQKTTESSFAPVHFYDGYDYLEFWIGREYEDAGDKIAVSRLFSLIRNFHRNLLDVGVGSGRMIPLYEAKWEKFILLDPSRYQLGIAGKNVVLKEKASSLIGVAESIPLPDASCDAVLCIRAFHYISHPAKAIREMNRVLEPGGYLILEIPNKLHFKNRLAAIFKKNSSDILSDDPMNIAVENKEIIFVNHNPKTIAKMLKSNGFEIVEALSASNLRSGLLKKFFPLSFLIAIEKIVQKPLARFWFGPSVYFLAKKIC